MKGFIMPFDSEGNFTRVHNWEEDRQNDIDIVSDRHDEEDDNFANGFNDCLLRDGRSTMTGNLKMGNFQIKNVANGTVSTDAVNKAQLDAAGSATSTALMQSVNSLFKIGDIKQSVKTENHDNWFLCNGQAVNRVTYSELFALIGTKFGAGDGTTTFNLPDYRGKFLRGLGGNSAANMETTQPEGLPNITGGTSSASRLCIGDGYGCVETSGSGIDAAGTPVGAGRTTMVIDASKSNSIYGASDHVTPINQAVNFFIKVKEEA